jgi:hypothetical protein
MKRLFLLTAVVLLPSFAAAQGIGDAAARQRQKREQQAKPQPPRVYGNDDLPSQGTAPAAPAAEEPTDANPEAVQPASDAAKPAEGAAADPPASAAAESDDTASELDREREERKRLEAEWRMRFTKARERLAAAEESSWQEVVRTEYYQGIPVQMRVKEQTITPELRAARQAIVDLEDEFRRTGQPPAWAR